MAESSSVAGPILELPAICGEDLFARSGMRQFTAILMDPDWSVVADKFNTLRITEQLIPHGMLFIWTHKALIPMVVDAAARWGFKYAESLSFVKRTTANRMVVEPSGDPFASSKETLLCFRKTAPKVADRLELRHQRNQDVVFDFARRHKGVAKVEKPRFIWDVLETMLPHEKEESKMLKLWADRGESRQGWLMVHEAGP